MDDASACVSHRGTPQYWCGRCDEMANAYRTLLDGSREAALVEDLYRDAAADLCRIAESGVESLVSIVIVGLAGEGKSWLAECFLLAGADGATGRADRRRRELRWFGPTIPENVSGEHERLGQRDLLALGRTFTVCDAPALSHAESGAATVAVGAAMAATVCILVVREEHVRDGRISDYMRQQNGAIIIPAIRLRGAVDASDEVRKEVAGHFDDWGEVAPQSEFEGPIYIPDFHAVDQGEACAREMMRERLAGVLRPLLGDSKGIRVSVESRLKNRVADADRRAFEFAKVISDKAREPLRRLRDMERKVLAEIGQELLGGSDVIRAHARIQLRKRWLQATWDGFFPYKPFVGMFAITAGAWDRVVFLAAGSVTSLAGIALQVGKNIKADLDQRSRFSANLASRLESSLAERCQGDLAELAGVLSPSGDGGSVGRQRVGLRMTGVEELQVWSRRSLGDVLDRHACRRVEVFLLGATASVLFIAFLAAPVITVFWSYLLSCWVAGRGGFVSLDFTLPRGSMMLGVFTLASLPVAFVAWLSMVLATRNARRAAEDVERSLEMEVAQRSNDGRLRFEVDDERVEALRKIEAAAPGPMDSNAELRKPLPASHT